MPPVTRNSPTRTRTPSRTASPPPVSPVASQVRPVLYPEIQVNGVTIPITILTLAAAKKMIGWETEEDYYHRTGNKIDYGDNYTLIDINKKKVRCSHNNNNRPYTESWSRELAQSILSREWADSRNGPDMSINGETIIITRYGDIDSGQHRIIGFILACQLWQRDNAHWAEKWPQEPTMEVLIVTGISGNPKVTQTLDNVKPRSLSDVFYTSPLFKSMSTVDRGECSRMLAHATNLLWERTRVSDEFTKYQTHSASMDLVDRHPRLLDSVKFMFDRNSDRVLSHLKLRTGDCAGLHYLMAVSRSDAAEYHNGEPPSEKLLHWGNLESANTFFKLLTNTKDEKFQPLREAIARLVDLDIGLGGRAIEKHALLCKAWGKYMDKEASIVGNPPLHYRKNAEDQIVLDEKPNVGGIDSGPKAVGEVKTPDKVTATPEKKQKGKVALPTAPGLTPAQVQLKKTDEYLKYLDDHNKMKKAYPDRILLYRTGNGDYRAWAGDATAIALIIGGKTARHESGMTTYVIPAKEFTEIVKKLIADKKQVSVLKREDGATVVTDIKLSTPSKPAAVSTVKTGLRGGT